MCKATVCDKINFISTKLNVKCHIVHTCGYIEQVACWSHAHCYFHDVIPTNGNSGRVLEVLPPII